MAGIDTSLNPKEMCELGSDSVSENNLMRLLPTYNMAQGQLISGSGRCQLGPMLLCVRITSRDLALGFMFATCRDGLGDNAGGGQVTAWAKLCRVSFTSFIKPAFYEGSTDELKVELAGTKIKLNQRIRASFITSQSVRFRPCLLCLPPGISAN